LRTNEAVYLEYYHYSNETFRVILTRNSIGDSNDIAIATKISNPNVDLASNLPSIREGKYDLTNSNSANRDLLIVSDATQYTKYVIGIFSKANASITALIQVEGHYVTL